MDGGGASGSLSGLRLPTVRLFAGTLLPRGLGVPIWLMEQGRSLPRPSLDQRPLSVCRSFFLFSFFCESFGSSAGPTRGEAEGLEDKDWSEGF